jgi:hypothetical protein
VRTELLDVSDRPDAIVGEFRARFYDTGILGERYAGNRFAQYLFRRHETAPAKFTADHAHRIVEEAQLFIEAAYASYDLITERRGQQFSPISKPAQVSH